jgi:hypothetical protein
VREIEIMDELFAWGGATRTDENEAVSREKK